MPLSPHFSPRASGFEEDGEAEGAGSVRSKIVQGLALVKRNLGRGVRRGPAGARRPRAQARPACRPPSPADLGSPAEAVPRARPAEGGRRGVRIRHHGQEGGAGTGWKPRRHRAGPAGLGPRPRVPPGLPPPHRNLAAPGGLGGQPPPTS